MSTKRKNSLDLQIRWKSKGLYEIVIDGDKFYAVSYHKAVCLAFYILSRDELLSHRVERNICDQ